MPTSITKTGPIVRTVVVAEEASAAKEAEEQALYPKEAERLLYAN